MNTPKLMAIGGFLLSSFFAQAQLDNGLVSYWPLDSVQGTKTPDLVSGYDMDLNNLTATDLVPGKKGNAFSFSFARQTLLSRVHNDGDDLPLNQHESFTISMWVNLAGTGQNDLRIFSEGNTGNSTPLFNLGTHNGGADGTLDVFIRQTGWTTVNHLHSTQPLFDSNWRHMVYVENNGVRSIYIDGVRDDLVIPDRETGFLDANNTTIGGILRSSASHWVTGLIDEVAVWKRGLTEAEITELNTNGLVSLFPPILDGLVSHWPLDEVQGTKTPDVVSGYDMDLNNLSAADLVPGKTGNAFSFSFARQTLLSRVHNPNDDLPANKHESFTISIWANVQGTGQNDLRIFSEGNTGNSTPLFNLGTHSGGSDGTLDVFIRQTGWTTVNHVRTLQPAFDSTWRHIVYVENDGVRSIYIDGVLDGIVLPDREDGFLDANDTTIGGILRSSASHWVTGLLDDVAIWKRALTASEVQEIFTNGIPEGFSRQLPLEIRRFKADYNSVVAGGTATLRWDVSKDAQVSIEPGIGDVTALTSFGAGSTTVTVDATTVYTMTISRGAESLTSNLAITAVGGIAENWDVLDRFSNYRPGGLGGNGSWLNPEGLVSILDLGKNKVVGFDGGGELSALTLNSFTVKEGEKATLFFRVHPSLEDTTSAVTVHIGITEKPIRFNGDFNNAVGPFLRFEKVNAGDNVSVLARNGVGADFTAADLQLEFGKVYNFWIDVQNDPIATGDKYSVHVQEEGAASRTTIFDNFVSDRDPAGSVDLGLPKQDLISVFMSAPGGQGINNFQVDDFFISHGQYNSTVPVPADSFEFSEPTIDITILSGEFSANGFDVTWESDLGRAYSVETTSDFTTWNALVEGYPAGGALTALTTYTDTTAGREGNRYYRVTYVPPAALFEEDFEGNAAGWTVFDNSFGLSATKWELGAPSNGPGAARSGTKVYGTDLDSTYEFFTDTMLRSPVIDLTGLSAATLEFYHFLDVEGAIDGTLFDYGQVNILDANDQPLQASVLQIGGTTPDWRSVSIPLPNSVVGQRIRIEFRLVGDDFNADIGPQQGWYIDDVRVIPE